jgi:2-(1,2-epoxy-1,2-dihydrophenyl)acetyl-CoA isomerase
MLLHQMPKVSIAMVGGPAVGAGFALAGACDLRFASDDALFCAGFSPNGLSGDYGGSFFWTRIAGTALTRRLYLLNEKIGAAQALAWGMVHEVRAAAELRGYTLEIASILARTPREVVALMKDNLNQAEDEVDRRRWLLANEAENQSAAGRAMMARMTRRQQA